MTIPLRFAIDNVTELAPPNFTYGVWTFWTCVYNVANNTMYLYRDGGLVNSTISTQGAPGSNTNALMIGRHYGGTRSDYLDGSVDEIAIWNRVLTPTEISNLYNSEAGRYLN